MLFLVLSGYLLAGFVPFLHRIFKDASGWVIGLLPAGIFFYLLTFYNQIALGESITIEYAWVDQLNLSLSFYLDGLSLLFALLISGFGCLIFLYSGSYLRGHQLLDRFYMYLLIFMASMLGVVLSGNIIGLFMFWELTSLSSYLLIGFNHESEVSRKAALQAMLVTVFGGLALLGAVILIGITSETFSLSTLLNGSTILQEAPFYQAIVILLLLGAFTKSAQFPFYFWLPNAMAAPTPVSAYLHSATMVKAGVYLVARFTPLLGDTPLWNNTIVIAGTITMVMGAVLALFENDIKRILAYTTLSALGMLFMTLGIGTPYALKAAMTFLVAHAFYKCALFLIAGNIDLKTRSRDINVLSGLWKKMPWTGSASLMASASMAAFFPALGFIAKEMVLESALHAPDFPYVLVACVIVSGVAFVIVAIILSYRIFFGRSGESMPDQDAPFSMVFGPGLLAVLSIVFGLFSTDLLGPLLNSAFKATMPSGEPFVLGLWHGFNTVLWLSIVTLVTGIILYKFRRGIGKSEVYFSPLQKTSPEEVYFKLTHWLQQFAEGLTRVLQNGYLRVYIAIILATFISLIFVVAFKENLFNVLQQEWSHQLNSPPFYEILVLAVMVVALVMLIVGRSRLTAIIGLGIVGYGVGLIFIFFGAPDVAITQFLIETLTVILFVLVLHKLPEFRKFKRFTFEKGFILVPVLFGCLMTFILLLITNNRLTSELKKYFVENSYTLGKGKNIVNVILVDFRAMDTMGEITVLSIAAIGIYALLYLKLRKKEID